MMSILSYSFFQYALLGSLLASILCGMVGTYIVSRRLVFISGGLSHASLGGIGLGVWLGINPLLSALVFAVASACGIQWLSRQGRVREDSAIALFWTFGMSLGIICCFLTPGFMSDLSSYLFGSILTITGSDLWLLGVVTAFTLLCFTLGFRLIRAVAFDAVFARSLHLPVTLVEYLLMVIIALTVVATLRLVGIVLVISLLTIPQTTAALFTSRLQSMMLLSILFGCIGCLAGLALSYWFNVPSGAAIICFSILLYLLLRVGKGFIRKADALEGVEKDVKR